MTSRTTALALSCLILAVVASNADEGQPAKPSQSGINVYGYQSLQISSQFTDFEQGRPGETLWGSTSLLRLKADWNPEDRITFHLEAAYTARLGQANPVLAMTALGYPSPLGPGVSWEDYQQINLKDDFVGELVLDHAWGAVDLGFMDLRFGRLPIAWGTAYFYNPSDRVNMSGISRPAGDETPGTLAVMPTIFFDNGITLTSYLSLSGKGRNRTVIEGDADPANLPFGIRLSGLLGVFDISASLIKESRYSALTNAWQNTSFMAADFVGDLGFLGLYGELALALPGTEADFKLPDSLLASVGMEKSFRNGPSLKLEYIHHGPGVDSAKDYNFLLLPAGETMFLGRNYLFAYIEHTMKDYLKVALASLANMGDKSFIVLPELSYSFMENFSIKAGAQLPFGPEGSEYNGRFDPLTGLGSVAGSHGSIADLAQPSVFIELNLSF